MHILIAPNAFKNSLTAIEAAAAIQAGFQQSKLACTLTCFPIADGGDGTREVIIKKCGGVAMPIEVQDALGRKIKTGYGILDGGDVAVIEMADASGLRLLKAGELNPLLASSFGTGEMIKAALDKGVKRIIVGMGGSATVDGGTGILKALGIRFQDSNNVELANMPGSMDKLHHVDLSHIDPAVFNCEIIVLCDVDNSLLGSSGAAAMFGPQKGASAADVVQLEAALSRLRDVILKETGKDITTVPFGGTAGGAAAGVYALLNAKLVNGADYFFQLTNFKACLQKADLVITGEGSIDEQTLQGKGPFGVARLAKEHGVPVIGLAGRVPSEQNPFLKKYFSMLFAIGNGPSDVQTAMQYTGENLTRVSREIGDLIAHFAKPKFKRRSE